MNQETKENKVIILLLILIACGCFAVILVTTFMPKSEQPAQQTRDGVRIGVDVIMEEEDSAGNKTQITLNETLHADNSSERR